MGIQYVDFNHACLSQNDYKMFRVRRVAGNRNINLFALESCSDYSVAYIELY